MRVGIYAVINPASLTRLNCICVSYKKQELLTFRGDLSSHPVFLVGSVLLILLLVCVVLLCVCTFLIRVEMSATIYALKLYSAHLYIQSFVGGNSWLFVCVCFPIVMSNILLFQMTFYVLSPVLWCPIRFLHKMMFNSPIPQIVSRRVHVLLCVINIK